MKFTIVAFVLLCGLNSFATGTTHQVATGMEFSPDTVNCMVGDSIRWTQVSYVHTTTSTSVPGGATTWDQPIEASSPVYSRVLTVPGTYTYECTPHGFTGTVNVSSSPTPVTHIVMVNSSSFSPNNITCSVGDTIRWVHGAGFHTTESTSVPTGASGWAAPITSSVPTFDYVVTVGGTYNYVCGPHGFTGQFTATGGVGGAVHTVTVEPAAFNPVTINCAPGDTVRWVLANETHSTVSGVIPSGAAPWSSAISNANPTFAYIIILRCRMDIPVLLLQRTPLSPLTALQFKAILLPVSGYFRCLLPGR
jgi:plastocyanin